MMGQRMSGGNKCTLRRVYLKCFLLLTALGILMSLVSMQTEGQNTRERRVTNSSEQITSQKESQPAPKPTPKAATTAAQSPTTFSQNVGSTTQNPPPTSGKPAGTQQQPPVKQNPQRPPKPGEKVPEPEAETIRINSNLVAVPVSVTDAKGQPIRNLKAEDFRLEEEGQVQQVQTLGEPGKTPIELTLLFDVSRSVRNRFDFEREAAGRFLKEILKKGDFVSVFAVGSVPKLAVERTDSAEKAIKGTTLIEPTDESTAFFDTVVKAARYLTDRANPGVRRVMVVISDGEDTNSERFRLPDALREIQRSDSLFYSINPSGPSIRLNKISMRGHNGMERLANETGGVAFLPDKLEDLTQVFSQIAAELQAQYLLGYYSTNERNDGGFRRISVRVPKQSELRIRARQGYYAPKE